MVNFALKCLFDIKGCLKEIKKMTSIILEKSRRNSFLNMKNRKKLMENKGYWTAKIQMDLFDSIYNYMEESNINKTELAQKMGVTKGYITQILNGDFDHKISKMVELALYIGKVPVLTFVDIDVFLKNETLEWEKLNSQEKVKYKFDAPLVQKGVKPSRNKLVTKRIGKV